MYSSVTHTQAPFSAQGPPFTSEAPSPGALMLDVPQPWEVCNTLLVQAVCVISEAWGVSKSVSPLPSSGFPGD